MSNNNLWKCISIFLFIIVIAGVFFQVDNYYAKHMTKMHDDAYNNATIDIVESLFERSVQCQSIPIVYGNQSLNLIAIECLPQEVIEYLQQASQQG